ncbi:hypothetical protein Clocel_0580 [Clostridium cellulovorans 743B]|uniref:DUF4829 domain-containing protein n=1 Tax=Clostridium cellulovorans (strain ATCC 35296 / DSM 3052 / OCM 3 / 743B) TaxID=573061 RepID=D9SR63_CLOC7|nr:hypothetical protein Clocel_0580 [Clostridium cellulovorans 743B]
MLNNKKSLLSIFLVIALFTGAGCSKTEKPVKESSTANSSLSDGTSNVSASYELEYHNDTRFFKAEIEPKSDAEKVILDKFKIQINDKYDELSKLFIDSPEFNNQSQIYKNLFDEGEYAEAITIHSLKKLSEEEYSNNPDFISYNFMDTINKFNPYEFQVIEVNYTIKLTDKYASAAQWSNGNWTRDFIVVQEKENTPWRIFDIYGYH